MLSLPPGIIRDGWPMLCTVYQYCVVYSNAVMVFSRVVGGLGRSMSVMCPMRMVIIVYY